MGQRGAVAVLDPSRLTDLQTGSGFVCTRGGRGVLIGLARMHMNMFAVAVTFLRAYIFFFTLPDHKSSIKANVNP